MPRHLSMKAPPFPPSPPSPFKLILTLGAGVLVSGLAGCREKDPLFTTLDLNGNGRLSLTELEEGVTTGLFKTYDTDHDGIISTAEWRKLDPAGDGSFLRQRDGNHDGRITRPEALASLRRRGFCREVLDEADTNNNGVIDPKEARIWVSDHPEIIDRLKLGD